MTQNQAYDIHKAAGIIVRDRKLLLCREFGKTVFIAPGGKLDQGEDAQTAVVRELSEELGLHIRADQLTVFGTFYAEAATSAGKQLRMDVFLVTTDEPIQPMNEIEEIAWITSQTTGLAVGSIFQHDVLPKLKALDLVD